MFSRLAPNRSPQHHPINFNKKKVLLPASVFNKLDNDRSISKQPRTNKSVTPQHKMELIIQPCKSKPLLLTNNLKDLDIGQSKSSFKKSYCQNCNSFLLNQPDKDIEYYDWRQGIKSIKDIRKRNQLKDLFQGISQKCKQIYQHKEGYEVEQQRAIESFNKQKEKINDFYSKMINIVTKHKQGIITVFEHSQCKVLSEIRSIIHSLELSIQNLSSVEQKAIVMLSNIDKASEQTFKQDLLSFKNQQYQVNSQIKFIKFKPKQINILVSDQQYITKHLINLVQRCLVLNNPSCKRKEGAQNLPQNMESFESLQQVSNSLIMKPKLNNKENGLQKYISIVDNDESECEMLLSQRG